MVRRGSLIHGIVVWLTNMTAIYVLQFNLNKKYHYDLRTITRSLAVFLCHWLPALAGV